MDKYTHKDIFFYWDGACLELGNSAFTRSIDWSQGMPKTRFMKIGDRLIAGENPGFDFRLAGFPEPGNKAVRCCYQVENGSFELLALPDGEGAKFTIAGREAARDLAIKISYTVYPDLPVMAVECEICSSVLPMLYWHERQRSRTFLAPGKYNGALTIPDSLFMPDFRALYSVECQMRTDYFDEPVLLHDIVPDQEIYGNILIAQNSGNIQFFYLQEAPPSMERRGNEPGDFLVKDGLFSSMGSGIVPDDITPGRVLKSNRIVCGAAADGDASKLIKEYLRCRQTAAAGVYGTITVNPWGCGCFPKLLNEDFLKDEICSASQLGADVYQIDDGYQHGGLADMAVHNRKLDRAYWQYRKDLLPDGFAPLEELARANDIKLSMWFAPSVNQAYCDWRESCDILLEHWRKNNFESFKLDGVIFSSYTAEENFGNLLKTLYKESGGAVSVNLDVTNGTRGGLFKFAEYGLIFLENRYCCHPWVSHPYHPGNTLDNLWNLARFCRIQNLQIEVPDPDNINKDAYINRSLELPTDYDFAYWAMIPLFASPLLWLAPSQLRPERRQVLAEIMTLQKKYRRSWRDSIIKPVGSRPDGRSITGLYADSGHLLVFREKAAAGSALLELGEFKSAEVLYSTSRVQLAGDGRISIERPGSAALLKLL